MTRRPLLAALAAFVALASAAAAEKAENPVYTNWSGFKKGASASYRTVIESPGGKKEITTTYTLVELTGDKVVVEMQVTLKADGKETKLPASRLDNPRYFTLPAGVKKEDFGKPVGVLKSGEETVTVGKVKYKTKWYTAKTRVEAGDMVTQTWSSREVPGALVKSVSKVEAAKQTTTMELIEVKKP